MPPVRRLAMPFRVVGRQAATVEQDSDADVLECCRNVVRYRPGLRTADPTFGAPPQNHRQTVDLDAVAAAIEEHEDRAHALAVAMETTTLGLAAHALVGVQRSSDG